MSFNKTDSVQRITTRNAQRPIKDEGENFPIEVTIVTPVYNSEKFISKTIESIIAQTVKDWELLLVDDCSKDNSVNIVQDYVEQDERIKLIQLSKNSGAAVARNMAIKAANGRYIAFLDSDDQWLPHKLHRQLHIMKTHNVAFTWAAYEIIDHNENVLRRQPARQQIFYNELLKKVGVIGCLTAMYDTYFFGKQYMPQIRMRQDYGLWLNLLRIAEEKQFSCVGIPEVLARYRVHASAMTNNKLKASYYQWLLYRDVEHLPFWVAVSCFKSYFFRGIIERLLKQSS